MRAFAATALVSATPLALWGCGGDDTTVAPTPAPPAASDVQAAWDNHFGAFATFDVDKIMLDYDNDSAIHVYNDHCFPENPAENAYETPSGLTRYKGTAQIKGFFENLFTQLKETLPNVDHVGPKGVKAVNATDNSGGTPEVRERTGNDIATANVFLTWRTSNLAEPIQYATDSFSWKFSQNRYWIDLQTIVVTESHTGTSAQCNDATRATVPADTTDIRKGWDNHFSAFGARNNVTIMQDYTAASIVQLYDNRDLSYKVYTGLDAIQGMFTELFAAMAAERSTPDDPNTEGLAVSLLEIEENFNSVFLAWRSTSHPKATDTFIFNGDKIIRQNIVVTTKTPPTPAPTPAPTAPTPPQAQVEQFI